MGDIDGLSRFRRTTFSDNTDCSHLICPVVTDIMVLCDPTTSRHDLHDQQTLFSEVIRLVGLICG